MRTLTSRAITTAAAAAIALTTMSLQPASAGTRNNDAAALAIFAGVLGTIAAIAATQHDDGPQYPYGAPGYGPVYGAPGYGGPVHSGPIYRGRVHGPFHGPRGWHNNHHR